MWVLTRAINDYNQEGAYLVAAYSDKPSKQELQRIVSDEIAEHLVTSGGGRRGYEHEWFYLTELSNGEEYQPR